MTKKQLFTPIGDKVVLTEVKKQKTNSGVIVPDMAQDKTVLCEVVAVGPGLIKMSNPQLLTDAKTDIAKRTDMQVKVGDLVYIPKFALHKVELDSGDYYVGKEYEILTILNQDDE